LRSASTAEHRGEDHHANHRHRARAGQVGEDVGRHEVLEQRGHVERLRFAEPALHVGAALQLARALHQAVGAQAEGPGHPDADHRRHRRGGEQDAKDAGADLAESARVADLGHRREDRHQHQRRDHHLEQPDVDAADGPDPGDGAGDGGAAESVEPLRHRAQHRAEQHRQEHRGGQRRTLSPPVGEPGQGEGEDDEVEDRSEVHTFSRRFSRMTGAVPAPETATALPGSRGPKQVTRIISVNVRTSRPALPPLDEGSAATTTADRAGWTMHD
jgi:hypothetical protein